jgi:hypothetical protein
MYENFLKWWVWGPSASLPPPPLKRNGVATPIHSCSSRNAAVRLKHQWGLLQPTQDDAANDSSI